MRSRSFQIAGRFTCGLFVLSGFLALSTERGAGLWYVALGLALIALAPLGEWLDARFSAYRYITGVVAVGYAATLVYPLMHYGLLDAVTRLVVFILAYRMLHRKSEHEYLQIFLMTFFLLLSACAHFPDPTIALVLPLFLVSGIWAFLALQLREESLRSGGKALATVTASGAGARTRAGIVKPVRSLVGAVVLVSLLSVALATAVFLVTPRIGAGFLNTGYASSMAVTGISDEVRVVSGETIRNDTRTVMIARFPEEPGGQYPGPKYWRLRPLTTYIGGHWRRYQWRVPVHSAVTGGAAGVLARPARGRGRIVKQVISADGTGIDSIACLPFPVRVVAPGLKLRWGRFDDYSVDIAERGHRSLQYTVYSEVDDPSARVLRACGDNYNATLGVRRMVALTRQYLTAQSLAVAKRITAGKRTAYDKVTAIRDWFSANNFFYTMTIPPLPRQHAIDAFINRTRAGHCELFATAMALMVRSLGIPARVVEGYRGGEWSASDKGYIIRSDMAHLWVEVYFPGYGWVTFDPSPKQAGLQRARPSWLTRTLSMYAFRARMFWYSNVIGYTPRRLFPNLNLWGRNATDEAVGGARAGTQIEGVAPIVSGVEYWVIGALTLGLALWGLYALRRRRKVGRGEALSADQERAVRLYRRFLAKMRRQGGNWDGKTAEEISREVAERGWLAADEANAVVRAYNEARFGGRPKPSGEFARWLRTLRRWRVGDVS